MCLLHVFHQNFREHAGTTLDRLAGPQLATFQHRGRASITGSMGCASLVSQGEGLPLNLYIVLFSSSSSALRYPASTALLSITAVQEH